jgi:hypothetical protein
VLPSQQTTNFATESFHQTWIECRCFRQELQCDLLFEFQVVRAIDLAHATAAEQTEDAIPLAEDDADREAPLVESGFSRIVAFRLKAGSYDPPAVP